MISKRFLILLIFMILVSCTPRINEKNELALPPFFREEYKEMKK